MNTVLFQLERRVVLFDRNTEMPDGSALGYDEDPNNANPDSSPSSGEFLIYNCPVGSRYQESDGTQWYKKTRPNVWKQFGEGSGGGTGEGSGGGIGSRKDIVFMLGDELEGGPQEHSEIVLPYKGTINKVNVSVGKNTSQFLDSNFYFAIQEHIEVELEGGEKEFQWIDSHQFLMGSDERYREYEVEIPIDRSRVRVNLLEGEYGKVSNMSLIAKLELEE